MRVGHDLRQEGRNVLPENFLDDSAEVGIYSNWVTTSVDQFENALLGDYEASPPSLAAAPLQPAVGGFPGSTSIPTTLGAASQQLRSRGIYIDYMSDDLRTAIDCLRVLTDSGEASDCDNDTIQFDKNASKNPLEYLPFFDVEYPSADSQPVTIAHLLNHSSGLPDDIPACLGCVHLEDEPALNQTDLLRDEKLPSYNTLKFEPGSEGVYTNVGYHTLGVVIEQASGLSYEEYVERNILDPLGMANTRFEYTPVMTPNAAVGAHPMADFRTIFFPLIGSPWPSEYVRDYEDGWAWFNRFLFDANPPSGLIGPAPEMARLVTALLSGGELDGARILSEETVEMMLTERHITPGSSPQWGDFGRFEDWEQGLGFKVVNDGGRVHHAHGGGGAAFRAFMRLYPAEELGIVMLVNGTNLDRQEIADAVADMEW
jgi:CubicO group peptidase (beta-lactamase class C family)